MAATTGQLGLVTPTQGTLPGQWGDTVNNGITEYVNIAIAGTLSFAGDGAITLTNTTGSASANNIGSTTAQYMAIRITGTLTTTKVITGPAYSKIYLVDNAATGGSVTFKAPTQTGVSIGAGTRAFVYFNGTDYVTIAGGLISLTTGVTGVLPVLNGGTGTTTSTGTGNVVLSTSPTLVTPVLGTPTSGNLANCTFPTLNQNTTGTAASVPLLQTTNFSISETGGKLVFKYGATTIASMDSSGNLTTIANVTAYGTP